MWRCDGFNLAIFFRRPAGADLKLILTCGSCHADYFVIAKPVGDKDGAIVRQVLSLLPEAVSLFRRTASKFEQDGYVAMTHADHAARVLPANAVPKSGWQAALDDLMLRYLLRDASGMDDVLSSPRLDNARDEPLALSFAAAHRLLAGDPAGALTEAQNALAAIAARKAARRGWYEWTMWAGAAESMSLDHLSLAREALGDGAGALVAARAASRVDQNPLRAGQVARLICAYAPDEREEAFEDAYRNAEFGGYDEVTTLPAYREYLARRKGIASNRQTWTWSKNCEPESDSTVHAAEATLGVAFPADYRRLLAERGRTTAHVSIGDERSELEFFASGDLATRRANFQSYLLRGTALEAASKYYAETYEVEFKNLVPVARPTSQSSLILLHLGEGSRYGWCFLWHHDDAYELESPFSSFDAALSGIPAACEQEDSVVLSFFGIFR